MVKKEKFGVNNFYLIAQEYADYATSDEEIRKIDRTKLFWEEMENMLRDDEIIINNINAKVRMSKSTIGIYQAWKLYLLMNKIKKWKNRPKFGIRNIARDEREYSQMMKDPTIEHTFIVTDEINETVKTGVNSTIAEALLKDQSNIQAYRYVHRINCSPKGVTDPNADIFIEVIAVDRKKMITHTHLYYRMFKGGNEYMQLIGYVDFDVSELITNWVTIVKKHFMKPKKTKKDWKIINEWRKKDFYVEYMCRKAERTEIFTKEGILRPQLLEYAEAIKEAIEELRPLAQLNIINDGTIMGVIRKVTGKHKIEQSLIGDDLMLKEIKGILLLWKDYFKMNKERKITEEKFNKMKIDTLEYENKDKWLIKSQEIIMNAITQHTEEMERYTEINNKYNHILTKSEEEKTE